MLEIEKLKELITDIESDHVERTISLTDTDKFGEVICAFANDFSNHRQPGYLIIGAKDNGIIENIVITDRFLQTLMDFRTDGRILPQPTFTIQQYSIDNGKVVVVEVTPSLHPPVRYKGKICIRIGPRRAFANEQEERMLTEKRYSTARTFDALPAYGATLEDIRIDLFKFFYLPLAIDKETLEANHRENKQQLASLRMYDVAHNCPTNTGIITLGIHPTHYLPGAYIQYVCFKGDDMTTGVTAEKVFKGSLINELKILTDFIDAVIIQTRPVRMDNSWREKPTHNYPSWAIRELVMNAIMHRDYQSTTPIYIYQFKNKVEIHNPGTLFGLVNNTNFPNASAYRNPEIAEAMKILGYINRFNYGIINAQTLLQENGNPLAEFDLSLITKFKVTIHSSNREETVPTNN